MSHLKPVFTETRLACKLLQQLQQSNRVDLIETLRSGRQTFFTMYRIFLGLQIIKECLGEKTSLVLYGPKAEVILNKAKEKRRKEKETLNIDFFFHLNINQ